MLLAKGTKDETSLFVFLSHEVLSPLLKLNCAN